ncbi:universal stress protein [Echinicola shivajiensis]|uniref:universal stress protein n=1 Tax=Echinicola shivajiensis TaxID=1035916 RepID=UPI001BFC848E|nr:universal stress protein [Echinicola shivajiensis]
MEKRNTALIGLDLTQMDQVILENTNKVIQLLNLEKIYFMHIAEDLALPEDIASTYPNLLAPIDESIEKEILNKVKSLNLPKEVKIEVTAEEGHPMEKLLRWSKIKNIDYIIMGRKKELKGSGALPKRIAQKAPNSVLFLTEGMKDIEFKKFIVPIDFSKHTEVVLERVEKFIKSNTDAEIQYLHVYEVPIGYHKTGKSYEEFAEIMLKNAQKEFNTMVARHKIEKHPCDFILKGNQSSADHILDAAERHGADMVVIGSRGRSNSAAILLGSVTEKLVHINYKIPMLVIKKKGENMSFLEALLNI